MIDSLHFSWKPAAANTKYCFMQCIYRGERGFDFAIRTPCTPARWNEFDTEMAMAWEVCISTIMYS